MNNLEKRVLEMIGEDPDSPDIFTDTDEGMAQIRDSINDAIEEITLITGSNMVLYSDFTTEADTSDVPNGLLTHIDSDDQGDNAHGVWGDGSFIFLANYTGGLHTYSVDDFGNLTHIDSDDQGDSAFGVWGDGRFIFLANYTGGLHVYSVDDSGNLTHIDSDDQGDNALGVWGDGRFIYLANETGGLHVYSIDNAYEYDKGTQVHTFEGSTVFNESGADKDFRVEGSGAANALFVQGSDGYVGIGTGSPATRLELSDTGVDAKIRITNGDMLPAVNDGASDGFLSRSHPGL